ncbi:TetR/AcrR family transcriptional regulator [Streptomyces sp. NPDC056390]|uniref:TetR/AcrR family transcriptional regulator n=1 Tax=Streptomyces sp. NPDC056390 TaxID=3345806 RepID=UPI0035DCB458
MTDATPGTPRPATTRDEQREASRRRLVDAALAILAEEGYGRLTIKQVGDRAGVSRGLVNYHFASKAGLIEAVAADIREGLVEQVRAVPGYADMSGLEAVLATMDRYFEQLAAPEASVRAKALLVLLVEVFAGPEGPAETMAGHLDLVHAAIEADIRRGLADGSIRADADPVAHALLVESIARGVLLQYQMRTPRAFLGEIGRAAHEAVRRALTR